MVTNRNPQDNISINDILKHYTRHNLIIMSIRRCIGDYLINIIKYSKYRARNYKVISTPSSKIDDFPELKAEIHTLLNHPVTIYGTINGQDEPHGIKNSITSPLFGNPVIGYYYDSHTYPTLEKYISNPIQSQRKLDTGFNTFDARFNTFIKIADLIETKYWYKMMAATIVGQGKTVYEAEIDCIGELVDFLRFNIQYAYQILKKQPLSTEETFNISNYLPLRGITAAITPFNFTAIAGNLAITPLLFGNTVYWKPSFNSLLSNRLLYNICIEAGIPHNLFHFIVMDPKKFSKIIINSEHLGSILMTGSTATFNTIYKNVALNIENYNNYPRLVGETGGKNYHFVSQDADIDLVVNKTFSAAFDYSGQKCSACSRLYLPEYYYEEFMYKISLLIANIDEKHYGVIDRIKFNEIEKILYRMENSPEIQIVYGGSTNLRNSYYVEPIIYISHNSSNEYITKELFAPILGIRLYNPENEKEMINECISSSKYALTGAIFSYNKDWLSNMSGLLAETAGNFYVNNKCTGAVVGHQPFGGFGKSGTNDKAGDINFLYKLFNQRNISISGKMEK